jgi:hypothetical protein
MKKTFIPFLTLTFILCLIPISASSALQAGDSCDSKGEITANGRYQCRSVGKTLKWVDRYSSKKTNKTKTRQIQKSFVLPNFVGYSQSEVNTWKRQNSLKISIHYSTAMGYDYSVNCQVHGDGTVLKQRPMAGMRVRDNSVTTIWLDIDC